MRNIGLRKNTLPNANIVASVDHVDEFRSGATAAVKVVTDWLVPFPPVSVWDNAVLAWRRHLWITISKVERTYCEVVMIRCVEPRSSKRTD